MPSRASVKRCACSAGCSDASSAGRSAACSESALAAMRYWPAAAPENRHVDQRPDRRRRGQGGSLVWGTILALVGVYFLLKETFEVNIPDIGRFWPVAVILIGVWFVWEGMTRSRS